MRIKLDVPLRLNVDVKVLKEFHDVLIKVRDASGDDPDDHQTIWNQLVAEVEDKLEYLKIRPAFVEDTKQQITDRRDEILRKIKSSEQQQQPQPQQQS